jgi:hypothetical protein
LESSSVLPSTLAAGVFLDRLFLSASEGPFFDNFFLWFGSHRSRSYNNLNEISPIIFFGKNQGLRLNLQIFFEKKLGSHLNLHLQHIIFDCVEDLDVTPDNQPIPNQPASEPRPINHWSFFAPVFSGLDRQLL